MRKLILGMLIVALSVSVSAQEKGKIRVGLDAGLALPNAGAGFGGDLDIRYNIMDNLNAGLKFTGSLLIKDIAVNQAANTGAVTASVISSTLATSDYYFSSGKNIFAPYLGGGLGFYKIMNVEAVATGTETPTAPSDYSSVKAESKFGGLLRGGFELGHFRLGLEYYLVPRSSVIDATTLTSTHTTANSFLNLSLGFYFGGGHWRK